MKAHLKLIVLGLLVFRLFGCSAQHQEAPPESFSFGVVADIQYQDRKPGGARHYRESVWKLQQCVDTFNDQELAFVVQLGDFINHGAESLEPMFAIYNQLEAPKYHVLGNHDFPLSYPKVLDRFQLEESYYDFAVQGWRFIVLDGSKISAYAYSKDKPQNQQAHAIYQKLKEEKAPNAVLWNGALGDEQVAWLTGRLEHADQADERVILCCHFPVYPKNGHNLWGDDELIALLESHDCVKAYLNGHNHGGNYGEKNGIHYLTFRAMVDTPDQASYAIVNVTADTLEVIGFGAETMRTLPISSR